MTAKKYSAILIDDEKSALLGLQNKVGELFPQLMIEAVFQKPEEAIEWLREHQPDIVFLDIKMPRMTGFELLSQLDKVEFQLIFVTAYCDYALEAIKKSAVGYILKPVDDDDLIKAVNKAIETIDLKKEAEQTKKVIELLHETLTETNKIIVPTSKGFSFIHTDDVIRIEGYEGYTKFHLTSGDEIVSSYNLGKFEKKLDNKLFFKCHKSHIINLKKVTGYENEGYILLENNHRVPISRVNKKVFLRLFE